jgi:RimJ/RimL family protein N-acetyltransferase
MEADALHFKTRRVEPFPIDKNDDVFVVAGLVGLMRQWTVLWRWSTIWGRIKLALNIAAGRDIFFGIRSAGKPVSTGVLAIGHCSFYKVEPEAVVISGISTDPKRRGEGFATRSIMVAMNAMIERGQTQFYIDTRKDNVAMQRSIEKLGFGQPISHH